MLYFDFKQHWTKRVMRNLTHPDVQATLIEDVNKFTFGRWEKPFLAGKVPSQFGSCEWDEGHRGNRPRNWDYVKHSASYWLVNFNLESAQQVEPMTNVEGRKGTK